MTNLVGSKVQIFNYKVVNTESIENIIKYKEHRRLKVFYHKGFKCVNYKKCGREGTIITHGVDRQGNMHIDICTNDLYPMTVDHTKPKSLGGGDSLDNLEPMCSGCNTMKGDMYNGISISRQSKKGLKRSDFMKVKDIKIGDTVYKRSGKRSMLSYLGEVVDIRPNPYHPRKELSAQIKDRSPNSLYSISRLYVKRGIHI